MNPIVAIFLLSLTTCLSEAARCRINPATRQVEVIPDMIPGPSGTSFTCPSYITSPVAGSVVPTSSPLQRMKEKSYCAELPRFRFEHFDTVEEWITELYDNEYQQYLTRIPSICKVYLKYSGVEPDIIIRPDLNLVNMQSKTWNDADAARAIFMGNRG